MRYDKVEIGATPAEENCAQVGSDNYRARAMAECEVYIRQLKRQFGEPPEGARYVITSNSHDYGTYHEVAIRFDTEDEAAIDYAFNVENNSPANWDITSKRQLTTMLGKLGIDAGFDLSGV